MLGALQQRLEKLVPAMRLGQCMLGVSMPGKKKGSKRKRERERERERGGFKY